MGLLSRMKEAASQEADEARELAQPSRSDLAAEVHERPTAGSQPDHAAAGVLYETESHIAGKNARVRLWPERLEWERPRGVLSRRENYDMVLLRNITKVSDQRDGLIYHRIDVQTSAGAVVNTISFRVGRKEAARFREAILDAMADLSSGTDAAAPGVRRSRAPAASDDGTDLASQIQRLAGLRDDGILTEEEFVTTKTEILSRF